MDELSEPSRNEKNEVFNPLFREIPPTSEPAIVSIPARSEKGQALSGPVLIEIPVPRATLSLIPTMDLRGLISKAGFNILIQLFPIIIQIYPPTFTVLFDCTRILFVRTFF